MQADCVMSQESDESKNASDPVDSTSTEPIVAKLADAQNDSSTEPEIRVGSPFKFDPSPISGSQINRSRGPGDTFYDVGPLKYTAMGAVGAAILVLFFAGVASFWYPVGGTLIAALGCALSIFGMYSHRRFMAAGCLGLHLILFVICYGQSVGM